MITGTIKKTGNMPDKLVAGFLALLTAFSPVASVVPVYASGLDGDGMDSSVTLMNSDGMTSVLLVQFDTLVPVYNVDGSSDYWVAYVNTMQNDSRYHVSDATFANNNRNGEALEVCVYDYDTDLAYIPKSYFYDENGGIYLDQVQVGFPVTVAKAADRLGEAPLRRLMILICGQRVRLL